MTCSLNIIYVDDFADVSDFEPLSNIDWVQRENTPRKEYWDTTLGEAYTYGSGNGIRTYEPNPRLDIINKYRDRLEEEYGVFYEGCFLNKYDTKKDWLGWHSDDDEGIDHSKPIAVITLGQEREINWKPMGSKGNDSISRIMLKSGSLFIMPAGMQQTHLHKIPKSGKDIGVRISLTFRSLMENKND